MKILAVSLLCLSMMASCKKEKTQVYQSRGVLLGPDMGMCAMCGGMKVQIRNDTSKNPPPFYRTNSDFRALGLAQTLSYPANVSLDWHRDTSAMGQYGWIIVTAIKAD